MACKLVDRCRLHRHFLLESTLHFWRSQWCDRGFGQCVRLQRHDQGLAVPDAMLPSGEMLKLRRAHVPAWVEALRARDVPDPPYRPVDPLAQPLREGAQDRVGAPDRRAADA